jgi:hypothetical protein
LAKWSQTWQEASWPSSFRGEDLFNISQSLKGLLLVAMFIGRMEPNEEAL